MRLPVVIVGRVRPLRRRVAALAAVALTCVVMQPARTKAQGVSAPALKAAFLFNFAKFAEWPSEAMAPGMPLTLCVFGDEAVGDALADILKNRPADSGTLSVRRLRDDSTARSCHVLYLAGMDMKRAISVVETVKGLPVLTVSDVGDFARTGGIAEFFEEGGKMRFAINTRAVERAHLRLSSRLLSLAKIVRDEGNVVQR
jgi:hypothetical protein